MNHCGVTEVGSRVVDRLLGVNGERKDDRHPDIVAADVRAEMGRSSDAPLWRCSDGCDHPGHRK